MEFLDPKKHKQHLTRLFIGYFLIAIALILTTIILLYRANGFGLKDGQVIQNGLIFVSSGPDAADIYVNGQKREEKTNVRLLMPAGQYAFELRKEGYRPWKRAINIEGGKVARFDYPFLFPIDINSQPVKRYDVQPGVATQSPDDKWLVVQIGAAFNVFDVFDLTRPEALPETLTLPPSITTLTGSHSWKVIEWAGDNRHILMQHTVTNNGKTSSEYILVDREDAAKTVNLTATLGANPTKLEFRDKKYDKYLLFAQQEATLSSASLAQPEPELLLSQVVAYKSHGEDTFLYATSQGAPAGKMRIELMEGDKSYSIRQVSANATYMLDVARYDNAWYIVAGSPSENRTYVYKNPAAALNADPDATLVPVQVLKTQAPQFAAFSDNARFIMVQNGQQFSVYDAENEKGYSYTVDKPIDAAQVHADWIDGHRMAFTSAGQLIVFDFDKNNQQTLVAADAAYRPFFDRDFESLYTLAPQVVTTADGTQATQFTLLSSPLRIPADQ